MRKAPRGGYDFSRKRDYRRKVWATFREKLKEERRAVADSQALLMPSLEGDEIEVALNAGFREENLHVVDAEPAIVATLKRRYQKINTYGVRASDAVARIYAHGIRLDCANFDFCNQLSMPFFKELLLISARGLIDSNVSIRDGQFGLDQRNGPVGAFASRCLVAVSTLRGRESKDLTVQWRESPINLNEGLDDLRAKAVDDVSLEAIERNAQKALDVYRNISPFDQKRLNHIGMTLELPYRRIFDRLHPAVVPIRCESYLSSNGQTMLWSIWEITQSPLLIAHSIAENIHRTLRNMPMLTGWSPFILANIDPPQYDDMTMSIWAKTAPLLADMVARTIPKTRFSAAQLETMANAQLLYSASVDSRNRAS